LGLILLAMFASAAPCAVSEGELWAQLALTYDAFDSAPPPHGWRGLNSAGCTDAAVALLQGYAEANAAKLSAEQKREMAFHAGQALAFAGRERDAIPHFQRADGNDAPEEWRAFVAAHLAFLLRDGVALAKARERYAGIAPGSMRLKFIDGFVACPDKSYMEAAHCAM
jgi:hypothetical protein